MWKQQSAYPTKIRKLGWVGWVRLDLLQNDKSIESKHLSDHVKGQSFALKKASEISSEWIHTSCRSESSYNRLVV